jgi:hypothetical protein
MERRRARIGLFVGLMLSGSAFSFDLPGGSVPMATLPETVPYRECFERAARQYDVPAVLLAAVARVESAFDPRAVSSKDALGVMQIRWPVTARHLGITRRVDLFQPCTSIDAGARYLRELHDQFRSTELALGAYNMGPSRIEAAGRALPRAGQDYVALVTRALARLGHSLVAARISNAGPGGSNDPKYLAVTRGKELRFRMPSRERAEATVRALHNRGYAGARVREADSSVFVVVSR